MEGRKPVGYQVHPFPKVRNLIVDSGVMGRRKHLIHALVEVDVTKARQYIRDRKEQTGETLSFTAYVIACLAHVIESNKRMHAYRSWRSQLVIFDDVDVNTVVERDVPGERIGVVYIIRAANRKTFMDIHREIRAAQMGNVEDVTRVRGREKLLMLFLSLPTSVRGMFWWALTRSPHRIKTYLGTVQVTAVGMYGKGGGWGIPQPYGTLTATIGGIAEKLGVVDGRIEVREYLDMTFSFDHDIIDGAPAARFLNELKVLMEAGHGLDSEPKR